MLKLFSSASVALLVLLSVAAAEFTGIPSFPHLKDDQRREISHCDHTIVIRDSTVAGDRVQHCEIMVVYGEDEKQKTLSQLTKLLNIVINEVSMDKMMNLMNDCDSLDDNITQESKSESKSSETNKPKLHIIVPGTKWCGSGNIAKSYHDLGQNRNVDRCCRAHDECPVFIHARDTMYNLKNNAFYTTSHCRCDEALYDCLKKDNGLIAKMTGELYFNVLRTKCIVGLPENKSEKMKIIPATRHW